MKKFIILYAILLSSIVGFAQPLPDENGNTPAIEFSYFPHPQYTFIWRNWSVVDKEKIAQILGTSVKNVEELASSMGLSKKQNIEKEWATKQGYITIIRRNWHLLPYDQIMQLLGMSREELRFHLIEDDFLFDKLGKIKPYCKPLCYEEPTLAMQERAKQIAKEIKGLGKNPFVTKESRFEFMREFETVKGTVALQQDSGNSFDLKIVYPYFATYGDALLDKDMTTYPEEMFRRLAEVGVNGIWIHTVLRTLVEPDDKGFPGDSRAAERIEGLQRLVERAAKYGVRVFLYMNEPRGMSPEWFESKPERKEYGGYEMKGLRSFCPSNPEVLNWLTRSLESVFTQVKGLGGIFTITASENFTTCTSRYKYYKNCPHCANKSYAKLQAAVNAAMERGVHNANSNAEVIVWDWKWPDSECKEIIENLPKGCRYMSVSEWSMPINRGGVESKINEYSMSVVGPGSRAINNWNYAKNAGLKCMAKVQVNCTWEMSITPSIPVLDIVAQHAENLSKEGVDGVFLSWSLGGYPTENLKLFQSFDGKMTASEAVDKLAREEYGEGVGALVREAWRECSSTYTEYPFNISAIYNGPHHIGPSNIFYVTPTNYRATMVGIPYDHYDRWRNIYPIEVWYSQMEKCAVGFKKGVTLLEKAYKLAKGEEKKRVWEQLNRAKAIFIHLQSSAVQGRFFEARNLYLKEKDSAKRAEYRATMRKACEQELQLIKDMLPVLSDDSKIAYESSNHYFYLPCDLGEAYLSVLYALRWLEE